MERNQGKGLRRGGDGKVDREIVGKMVEKTKNSK